MATTKLDDPRRALAQAVAPRERWTPSQWAEHCRILSPAESSEPGPWRNSRAPYLSGLMDAVSDPSIEEIIVMKGAQVGWSEAARNILGYWVDMDPGPCLIVCPDQQSAEDAMQERIVPLTASPAIARHVARPGDLHKVGARFDSMRVVFGWAGSSQRLKSRPIRYLILEEPDEYPAESGTGGDPVSKAMVRTTTYSDKGLARILTGGTPTTRQGTMQKRWDLCGDHRYFHVPCPHCGKFQRLKWSQIKWPELVEQDLRRRADLIESQGLAYYECEHCKGIIRDTHKPAMLHRGVWIGEGQSLTTDGQIVGTPRQSKRVGFFLPSYYSPWIGFSKLSSEWLQSQDSRAALKDFINQRLAEPFETVSLATTADELQEKANGAPPAMILPAWAKRLIATADTQGADEKSGYFYYVIRAWGEGWRSQLVDCGMVSTSRELYAACFQRTFEMMGQPQRASCQFLLIDSGGPRWQEIYGFCQSDPAKLKPSKGASTQLRWMLEKHQQREHKILLWLIDSQQTKDQLASLIYHEDRTLWMLNDRIPFDYIKQLTSEHKILERGGKEVWQHKPGKPPNHYWDCEHLQIAAAWEQGCGMTAPPVAPAPAQAPPAVHRRPESERESDDPRRNWMGGRPQW